VAHMTKEELREDPVLEWIQHAIEWTQHNVRWVAVGAAAVIIVVIAAVMITRGQRKTELEAQELLTTGQAYFLQGNAAAAEVQLRQLVDGHGGSAAARSARIYLADALAAQGRFDEALSAYSEACGSVGGGTMEAAAQRGKAGTLESLQRLPEASQAYEEAARTKTSFQADDLVAAARCALASGDPQRAKSLLERARELNVASAASKISYYLAAAEAATQH
jgi:tetratricopeptide (TPR) repeat protein